MNFHSHLKEEAPLFSPWECTAANHKPYRHKSWYTA